ncbi:Negative elongation factor A like protein [Argiope bruennichi]|uniref:Negative elongation factor A like protein n=1 Tax=Argiope bruennichi TaxID=94029 RepID=A0A8T0FHC4_ARGBR|nr:Negative elongation factor A like protein [Argiope bruennichi]
MAHVRDSDTSLWLHNKLGTSNDLWSGGSICSQLNQDVLRNIRECFIELQSQVKLKLLLSFLHIPRRNVEEWKVELEENPLESPCVVFQANYGHLAGSSPVLRPLFSFHHYESKNLWAKGGGIKKEQMQEAQDMFNKSNKVTRPEKALILGFIAGSRDNPCPHLGQIVTIMLSENEEKVQQVDGTVQTMIVETHFQMNYSTGEWKRVKKYRRMDSFLNLGIRGYLRNRLRILFTVSVQKKQVSEKNEITREGWMIFYDFKKGLTQQERMESLRETFGNEATSEKTVYNWFAEFRRGRASVSDESREGRPKSVVIPKNIDAVRKRIEEDPHVKYR